MVMNFFSALDTPGGHIFICVMLLVGYGQATGNPLAHDIAMFALGVLARSMGTKKDSATYAPTPISPPVTTDIKSESTK